MSPTEEVMVPADHIRPTVKSRDRGTPTRPCVPLLEAAKNLDDHKIRTVNEPELEAVS